MPWTETTRTQHAPRGSRYASDVSDTEWALIGPLLPPQRELGRPRETDLREVVNALFYLAWLGCPWRALPKNFPPYSTVQGYFYAWRDDGVLGGGWARLGGGGAGSGRPLCEPFGRDDRQPVGEDDGSWRAARLRWRQEDQGQEATYSNRYGRHLDRGSRPSRQRPGS